MKGLFYGKLIAVIMVLFDIFLLIAKRREVFSGGEELIQQNIGMSEQKDILTKKL
jgi:hypothetical protein